MNRKCDWGFERNGSKNFKEESTGQGKLGAYCQIFLASPTVKPYLRKVMMYCMYESKIILHIMCSLKYKQRKDKGGNFA